MRTVSALLCAVCWAAASGAVPAQDAPQPGGLQVTPEKLTLQVGETAVLSAAVRDESGGPLQAPVVFYSRSRRNVGVSADGRVEAYRPGEFEVVALIPKDPDDEPRRADAVHQVVIPVTVPDPPITQVRFQNAPSRFYAGSSLQLSLQISDKAGFSRPGAPVEFSSSDPAVARLDRFGRLDLLAPGSAEISAGVESASDGLSITVLPNPVASLEVEAEQESGRTGDVIRFQARVRDSQGGLLTDVPVQFSVSGETDADIIASGASAHIADDGRFVAERSGRYTVTALAGGHSARATVEIAPRKLRREVEVVGHGAVRDRHTSDFWVWQGADGRDYAITGTWGADGHAYIWDVTDPRHMSIVDVVRVDARTVNDVKVSEDGRIAVISREGASNRKNGIVVLDVSDVRKGVSILSSYDDQLTGGVHNVFVYQNHVFALSAGRRYDIISLQDPRNPVRVGRFELDEPGHGIHDVWVVDGIAYSSNWRDGVVAVDVGGGKQGGSLNRPVKLGSYAYPSGWNHAAFPYRSKSTGKFYVFAGDEAFPYGGVRNADEDGLPVRAAGWIHVIEWDDWESPREVARYQVPEAGSHNFWIEDDVLYIGYYNGGLRVVDVSGELMGDLYRQGREIAFWVPNDPEGFLANAPFAWGAMPYKGLIYLSDWNSGLWAVKLVAEKPRRRGGKHRFGEPQ